MCFPCRRTSISQPASAPGTVIDSTPCCDPDLKPRDASASRVIREPARPLALSATNFCSLASHTMANMSPPMPVMCGSVTLSTAAEVIAASIAFPPCCSTSSAAAEASGWLVATIPFGAYTTERPAIVGGRWACSDAGATIRAQSVATSAPRFAARVASTAAVGEGPERRMK